MEPFLIGLIAISLGCLIWPQVARRRPSEAGLLSALAPAGIFIWLSVKAASVANGEVFSWSAQWVPQLGVSLGFHLDGLGLLLAMLITGIGTLILIYGGGYFKGSPQAGPFFAFIQLFMLAMLGVVSSDNLLLLFIFWELTSLASYLLIGLSHEKPEARQSALRALLVTGAGGLALMAGVLLLGMVGGSYNLSELLAKGEEIRASRHYPMIFALIAFAAFTKSAQAPFHFWLPGAMVAPTPVSAYLHSATMVKAGVFLLAKLNPILGGTVLWHDTLTLVGAVTMLHGSFRALAQTDLKRLLAYSTMSALGMLVMLLGMGTDLAVTAAMLFLVVHALYKAPLFMIAGIVDKATGTRDIDQLRGLGRERPILAVAAAFAAFSMSGVPPFIGFVGKELLLEAKMESGRYSVLITLMGFAANAVNVAVALKVGISPFMRKGVPPKVTEKARGLALLLGPIVLTLLGAIAGLFPQLLGERFINAAVRTVVNHTVDVQLRLWHGFTSIFLMSGIVVGLGVLLYLNRYKVRAIVKHILQRPPARAMEIFDGILDRIIDFADGFTRLFQHGNLRLYIVIILGTLSLMIGLALNGSRWIPEFPGGTLRLAPVGVSLLMIASAVIAIRSRSTVMVILAMGGVGYGVALIFGLFGAPDLALTQVLIETLTLFFFALIMRSLPTIHPISIPRRRRSDAVIAIGAGLAVTLALLAVAGHAMPPEQRMSASISALSYPEGFGRNVVNVILVDFRALDTMGEISVLSIASIGIAGLLLGSGRYNRMARKAIATSLFRTSMRWLVPLLLLLSLLLLFRGHNEPGGGFIGGLVAGAAFFLHRMTTSGGAYPSERAPIILISAGLLAAMISSLAIFPREVWMQAVWAGSLWVPLAGETKFGTPFLFDTGVYLTVTGVVLLIFNRLYRRESAHSPYSDLNSSPNLT